MEHKSYSLKAHKAAILAEAARLEKALDAVKGMTDGPEKDAAVAAWDMDFERLQASQREYRLNLYAFGWHPDYRD